VGQAQRDALLGAFSVAQAGAVPVFIDSELRNWGIDPDVLESTLDERAAVQANARRSSCGRRLRSAVLTTSVSTPTAVFDYRRSNLLAVLGRALLAGLEIKIARGQEIME
jgi:dTDP-4-amino-4,6-dideoxygalactose transaminase